MCSVPLNTTDVKSKAHWIGLMTPFTRYTRCQTGCSTGLTTGFIV